MLAAAPVVGGQLLLAENTRSSAENRVGAIALDTIHRAEAAIDQGMTALTELSLLGVQECSPRDLDLMRRAVYDNFLVKEIGVVEANGLRCNHIGDRISVEPRSDRFRTRNPKATIQLVGLGEDERVGLMLVWAYSPEVGIATIIHARAATPDVIPQDLRDTASGALETADGVRIGSLPLGFLQLSAPSGEPVAAEVVSDRYPIRMKLAVPLSTFEEQNRSLLGWVNLGGSLVGILIFGLFVYVLRGPPGEVAELGRAVAREEFIPFYQPVIDIRTGRLIGCEVLVRWQKANGSIVGPASFIRLAETSGLAGGMTLSLMRQARRDLEEAFGFRPQMKISFNLVNEHFAGLRIVREVETTFGDSAIGYGQLVFEITERQPLTNIKRARVVIRRLQDLGARVALDDAGAGHAGLAYLQQLGVNIVKIDKLFIDTIGATSGTAPIVDSLVRLGHDLGMEVVAEGVETYEQVEYLRAVGADSAQGFLFSPPLPASAFLDLVAAMEPLSRSDAGPGTSSNVVRHPAAKVA